MAGVTPTGFDRKLEADCIAEIVAEARATVDPEFDDSPDSATGQIVNIVGSKWAESYEVLEATYNNFSPSASGAGLDVIAALTGTTRILNETDAQLRLRRVQELAGAGTTTQGAMRAALSKLTGVTALRVISNRTMLTVNSRPPKSVEALVLGGDSQEIGDTIWKHLAAGIATHGDASATVTDEETNPQEVFFTRPSPQNIHLLLSLKVDYGTYAGSAVLKQRIADFTSGALVLETTGGAVISGAVPIEGIIYRSSISAAALTVPGVLAVLAVRYADDGMVFQDVDYGIGLRSYLGHAGVLGFQVDHIQVSTA
jgi:hypothetical protein